MPYVIRWPHKRIFAAAAACCAMLGCAPSAYAWGSGPASSIPAPPAVCPMPAASPVFSALGDTASYSLVPGGSFDGSLAGWTLNNASVVPGSEPQNVSGSTNPSSLDIAPGGQATSPVVCVSSLFPAWRFFANAGNTSWATKLHVSALYTTSWGQSGQIAITDLNGSNYNSWTATNALPLGSVLAPGSTANIRFVFSADSAGADWQIADVYVDPYAR